MYRRWNRTHPVSGFQKFCYRLWNVHWLYHRSYYIDEDFCFSSELSQGIIRRVFTIKDSLAQLNELKRDAWSVLNFVGSVPSWFSLVQCHHAFVGISWVPNFFLWVFVGSKFFSRAHLVGPKFFLVGIRAFEIFLVGIYGSESFPLGYFMSPVFFSSCVFRGFNFFFLWLIS